MKYESMFRFTVPLYIFTYICANNASTRAWAMRTHTITIVMTRKCRFTVGCVLCMHTAQCTLHLYPYRSDMRTIFPERASSWFQHSLSTRHIVQHIRCIYVGISFIWIDWYTIHWWILTLATQPEQEHFCALFCFYSWLNFHIKHKITARVYDGAYHRSNAAINWESTLFGKCISHTRFMCIFHHEYDEGILFARHICVQKKSISNKVCTSASLNSYKGFVPSNLLLRLWRKYRLR